MLLTELILSKRGPLAKVWLSAHHEKKLSKQQALGVDVGESVEAILEQEDGPVTLRLSGQLMLGVTRIYSRKAHYLFEDCKETRENITRTFRPGVVDLPEDQQRSNNNAITLADTRNDFDFMDWSWNTALPPVPTSRESPGPARQHLRAQTREYGAYNFGRIAAGSIYGGSTPSRQSQDGDHTSKLDSHDFSGIDLQLDIDNDTTARNADFGTPEAGRRDATPVSHRSFSQFRGGSRDKSVDIAPGETFEEVDLGLDLDLPTMPELDSRSRRASSALSTPPPASPPAGLNDITPRMAAKIAGLPEPRARSSPVAPKAKKARLVQADDALELDDDQLAMNRDLSDILTVERYIPADPTITRMREIMDDPAGHFLPSLKQGGDSMFYVGPRDLAPELEELFTFPSNILRKRQDQSQLDERQVKRARTDGEEEDEVPVEDDIEAGRRQSVLPSEGNFGLGGDDGYVGGDQTFDDIQPGFEDCGPSMEAEKRKMRTPSVAPSVTETIARQIQDERSAGTHDLAMFEKDARDEAQSQSQVLTTPTKSVASDPISKTSSGYSKNTGMAMGLLRREIEAIEAADKAVGFDKLADKASKRAASAFFFELLVLGTRDAIKLEQREAFGDVEIRAKDKLFAEITV